MRLDEEYYKEPDFQALLSRYYVAEAEGKQAYIDVEEATDLIDYFNWLGDIDRSKSIAEHARTLHPGEPEPLMFLARHALDEKDLGRARGFLSQISDKDGFDYKYLKAELMIYEGREIEAESMMRTEFYREEKEEEPTEQEKDEFRLDMAELYLDYAQAELADGWLRECWDKESEDYLEVRMRCSFGLQDLPRTDEELNELIDCDPYNYQYWNMLANLDYFRRLYSKALSDCEMSMAIAPDNIDALKGMTHIYICLGSSRKALEVAKRALELYGNKQDGYTQFMEIFMDHNKSGDAKKLFEKVIEPQQAHLAEGEPRTGYTLMAMACHDCGYKKKFEQYLRLAVGYNLKEVRKYFGKLTTLGEDADTCFNNILTFTKTNLKK